MLFSSITEVDAQWLLRTFDRSPECAWRLLSDTLGDDVLNQRSTNDVMFFWADKPNLRKLCVTALTYAASRAIVDYDSCHLCALSLNSESRPFFTNEIQSNIYLSRYRADVLVHFLLLGFVQRIDAQELWKSALRDAVGNSKPPSQMEHRDLPMWLVKQKVLHIPAGTFSELAFRAGMLQESLTIDLFLLSTSGLLDPNSKTVPIWYSQLQNFSFMRNFEFGAASATKQYQGRTMAQMCESPLCQSSCDRILYRIIDAFPKVDLFYEANENWTNCPFSSGLQQAREIEKEPFLNTLTRLKQTTELIDHYLRSKREAPLKYEGLVL